MIRVLREAKRAPDDVAARIARAGGLNRFGEPNFRVVWGWTRLDWIGGLFTDRDGSGNVIREAVALRSEPKYAPCDRWHIERWMPPESYGSPEAWLRETCKPDPGAGIERIPQLGPYPSRGDYEHVFTLERPGGGFLQLRADICEHVVRAVLWALPRLGAQNHRAIEEREERRQKEWDNFVSGVLWDEPPATN
jgi:hypothetical protein